MALGVGLTYPNMVAHKSAEVLGTVFAGTSFSMDYMTKFFGIPVIMPASGYTQSAVVLAMILKTKDKKLKDIAIPAFISGLFGVTEPCIYGITLPKKKPFVISCIGGAAGGIITALAGVKSYTMGGLGLFGLPCYIDPNTNSLYSMIWVIISILVAVAVSFILTMIIYKDDAPVAKKELNSSATVNGEVLLAPVKGEVKPLTEVSDAAFSSEAMGKGIAIVPVEGKVYAPADGTITAFFSTGHAIGITTDKGAEVIIHVGMDTVQLEGKGFNPVVKQGDKVKRGDLLLEFDLDLIKAAGYSTETPIVITNSGKYTDIIPTDSISVDNGNELITLL